MVKSKPRCGVGRKSGFITFYLPFSSGFWWVFDPSKNQEEFQGHWRSIEEFNIIISAETVTLGLLHFEKFIEKLYRLPKTKKRSVQGCHSSVFVIIDIIYSWWRNRQIEPTNWQIQPRSFGRFSLLTFCSTEKPWGNRAYFRLHTQIVFLCRHSSRMILDFLNDIIRTI